MTRQRAAVRIPLALAGLTLAALACGGVSGCGDAESSEYKVVSEDQVAQAEADQLKPKPLETTSDDSPTVSGDQTASGDQASVSGDQTTAAPNTKADSNTTNDQASAGAQAGTTESSPGAEDNQDDKAAVKQQDDGSTGSGGTSTASTPAVPSVSQKGQAFLEQQLLKNRFNKKAKAREIKLLVKERSFKIEGPEDALRVSFDDVDLLKVLNMEPVPEDAPRHFPNWLKQLDGKRIRIRGFMYPAFRDTGLKGFVLARDNQICCFGKNPKIYDLMNVIMRKGKTTDYIQGRPFDVVGTLHIEESEFVGEMFWMDDALVIDDK